jgi:PAS domain-containing protein
MQCSGAGAEQRCGHDGCPDRAVAERPVAGVTEGEFRGLQSTLHWHGVALDDGVLYWLASGSAGVTWRNARIADLAIGASGIGIWETDLVSGEVRWDEQVYALHGLQPDDPRPANELQLLCPHPNDMQLALGPADLQATERWDSEFRVVWPDGSVHWLAARSRTQHGAHGKPLRLLGISGTSPTARSARPPSAGARPRRMPAAPRANTSPASAMTCARRPTPCSASHGC